MLTAGLGDELIFIRWRPIGIRRHIELEQIQYSPTTFVVDIHWQLALTDEVSCCKSVILVIRTYANVVPCTSIMAFHLLPRCDERRTVDGLQRVSDSSGCEEKVAAP